MEKVLKIIGIIVVIIFIFIYFEEDIVYFFRLILREIKHNRKISKLMNKGKKRRWIKNSIIEKYVNYVNTSLKNINYNIKGNYKLDTYLAQRLKYSKFDDKILQELLQDILRHMEIDYSEIIFDIRRTSSKTRTSVAGSYNDIEKRITLEVTTYSTLDSIISTLAHECTHHLLLGNGIKLEKREHNEILTDITAVYLGFGDYFYRAYKDEKRIIYDGEYTELIDRHKLGYIGYGDVRYIQKYSKKVKHKSN